MYGCTLREISISNAVIQHFRDIDHDINVHDITYENSQARERTQILMDIANQEGGLVVGTGDLSELALGWATYNGDHMSMYGVNCSIPKTLVRYLVSYESERTAEINESLSKALADIVATPVSPVLRSLLHTSPKSLSCLPDWVRALRIWLILTPTFLSIRSSTNNSQNIQQQSLFYMVKT